MFFSPPQQINSPTVITSVASVAKPTVVQKASGSAPINRSEYILIQGLTQWQKAYTPASAAVESVPSSLNGIIPRYGFLPATSGKNQSWSYSQSVYNGLPAGYVCLSGIFTSSQIAALYYTQRFFPKNGYFFSFKCGSYTSYWPDATSIEEMEGSLTFWLNPAPNALAHLKNLVWAATHPNPILSSKPTVLAIGSPNSTQ